MDTQSVEKLGFWGAGIVAVMSLSYYLVKEIAMMYIRIREKETDAKIRLQEANSLSDIKKANEVMESRISSLIEENKTLKMAIDEIKESHEVSLLEFHSQVEELKRRNLHLEAVIEEKELEMHKLIEKSSSLSRIEKSSDLHKHRFFVKMENFIYKLSSVEHKTDVIDYCLLKIECVVRDWAAFIDTYQGFANGKTGLEKAVQTRIQEQIKHYKAEAEKMRLNQKVMKAYDVYHEAKIAYIFDVNTQIIYSDLYMNNIERFDALLSSWVSIFASATATAIDMNERLIYRNVKQAATMIQEEIDTILGDIVDD